MTYSLDCGVCGQAYEVRSAKPVLAPVCPWCRDPVRDQHADRRDDEDLDNLAFAVVNLRRRRP
jgi:hypothetical protein